MPSFFVARMCPWPAVTPFSLSTRTRLVNPNSLIEAAICKIRASEFVLALRSYGISASIGRYSMASCCFFSTEGYCFCFFIIRFSSATKEGQRPISEAGPGKRDPSLK